MWVRADARTDTLRLDVIASARAESKEQQDIILLETR